MSFKNKNSSQKDQIGCDLWWINKEGELVLITKNLELYIYFCDVRHYSEEINDIRLTPILPLLLLPQHALVIKFVPNDYSFCDLEEELKKRYASIYNIEEMKGTMRFHSRHIRLDVYNKDEHRKTSNSGTITLSGLLCEVDEYLPAPRILICTRYVEDAEKTERLTTMINVILHVNPNRLPPHIQMFIPFDCRNDRAEKVISNTKDYLQQQSNHEMPLLTNKQEWPYLSQTTHNINLNQDIKTLKNELDSSKSTYKQEVEKINNDFQKQTNYLHIACSIMKVNISTQKEIAESTLEIIKDLTFDVNQNVMNRINKCFELMEERTTSQQAKQKIGVFKEDLKNYQKYATERQATYNNYVKTLETLWTKQTDNIDELLEQQITNPTNEQ
ncbi:hypothetical protein I4U23_011169 [Adineta vaga]|nr:hypothetical protein I4U23_011169 [Adineta vaga]